MRQIVLDTETTGLEPGLGHRIIEIGCVELINRRATGRRFHRYLNPERDIDEGALAVHGITRAELEREPRFAEISEELLEFVRGAELIIHNAAFDIGFINHELQRAAGQPGNGAASLPESVDGWCKVIDSLALARGLHPGQKNDLDSLCKRYQVDNAHRTLHGARLDAEILADVYLAMTGGQAGLFEESRTAAAASGVVLETRRIGADRAPLIVILPNAEELAAHQAWLDEIDKESGGRCLWKKLASAA